MSEFARKNFKRTAAAVLLCGASLVVPALAQSGAVGSGAQNQTQGPPPPPPPPPNGGGPGMGHRGPQGRLEMYQEMLNLTPDQTVKVKAILEDTRAQMMALRNDEAATPEEQQGKMRGLQMSERARIKALLDDNQKAKLEAMQQQRRQERRGNGGGEPPPPPPPPASPQQ